VIPSYTTAPMDSAKVMVCGHMQGDTSLAVPEFG